MLRRVNPSVPILLKAQRGKKPTIIDNDLTVFEGNLHDLETHLRDTEAYQRMIEAHPRIIDGNPPVFEMTGFEFLYSLDLNY